MARLHADIFPARGTRVRIADLGDKFPEVQITSELYDIEQSGLADKLYAEMDDAIRALNENTAEDSLSVLDRLRHARQELELLKVPIFEELGREGLSAGLHVAFFVNYRATVDELCKRLKTDCRIDGRQRGEKGSRERIANMNAFQDDTSPWLVGTSAACGISIDLHDVRGEFPRLGVVSLGYSAREFRQLAGRLRRQGGKSKALYRIPLLANTVETKVHSIVSSKLNCLDALNDGDLWAANLPLTNRSVDQFLLRDE